MADYIDFPGRSFYLHPAGPKGWKADDANAWVEYISSREVSGGLNLFSVRDYGAAGDGDTDDTEAIRAAVEAAKAYVDENGDANAVVWFDPGIYAISGPTIVDRGSISIVSPAAYSAKITPYLGPNAGARCNPFIFCSDLSDPEWPHGEVQGEWYVESDLGGVALNSHFTNSAHRYMFNLSESYAGRLPGGVNGFTLAFRKTVINAPTDFRALHTISGGLATDISYKACWNLTTVEGALKLQFRYNGQYYDLNPTFTNQPAPHVVEGVPFEFSFEFSGTKIRCHLNGELWTLGDWTPTGGGGGSLDSSGFTQLWHESQTLGSGSPSYGYQLEAGNRYEDHTTDWFHFSNGPRWGPYDYTPSNTKPTRDFGTRLCITFDERYKGCLVADGAEATRKHYFYPWTHTGNGFGSVELKNLAFEYNLGLKGEQNLHMIVDTVRHYAPEDGWLFYRNGYYSHFSKVDVVSAGRVGLALHAGSYVDLTGVKAEGACCFVFSFANVFGVNVNAGVRGNGQVGMFTTGGSVEIAGFNIDAEDDATVPWQGAVYAKDALSLVLNSPTLYNPPNKRTDEPIIVVETNNEGLTTSSGSVTISTPTVIGTESGVLVTTQGAVTVLARPVIVSGVRWIGPPMDMCNVPANVVDIERIAGRRDSGTITISDTDLFAVVTLNREQPDTNYRIKLSTGAPVGTPDPDSLLVHWSDKQTDQFTINLRAAPGADEAVEIDWEVSP